MTVSDAPDLRAKAAQAVLPVEGRVLMGRWLDDFNRAADALRQGAARS